MMSTEYMITIGVRNGEFRIKCAPGDQVVRFGWVGFGDKDPYYNYHIDPNNALFDIKEAAGDRRVRAYDNETKYEDIVPALVEAVDLIWGLAKEAA